MSEPEAASTKADLDALKALEEDTSELERIEDLLDRFNVFEAIGFVGQELVHSRFLAFLLDPRQRHGLGDTFFKGVLREALKLSDEASLVDLRKDLDAMDLSDTIVRREHRFIDVLLENEDHELAVIVENKVWTTEHHDQLGRYHRSVKASHPGWRVLGIYLTPFGSLPSRDEDRCGRVNGDVLRPSTLRSSGRRFRASSPRTGGRCLPDRRPHRVVAAVHVDQLPGRRRPPVRE